MTIENGPLNLMSQVTSVSSFSCMVDARGFVKAAQNGNMLPVEVCHQQLTIGFWLWP